MKREEALQACAKCGRWPMVLIERQSIYWRPHRTFYFVCNRCDHRQDEHPKAPRATGKNGSSQVMPPDTSSR